MEKKRGVQKKITTRPGPPARPERAAAPLPASAPRSGSSLLPGVVLGLLAALLQFQTLFGVLAVGAVYAVGQVVESLYLTPRLLGERIGLHPIAVIFALMAFGHVLGFVGVLIALPASAVLLVGVRRLQAFYMRSPLYMHGTTTPDGQTEDERG